MLNRNQNPRICLSYGINLKRKKNLLGLGQQLRFLTLTFSNNYCQNKFEKNTGYILQKNVREYMSLFWNCTFGPHRTYMLVVMVLFHSMHTDDSWMQNNLNRIQKQSLHISFNRIVHFCESLFSIIRCTFS